MFSPKFIVAAVCLALSVISGRALAVEELIQFKVNQAKLISTNNINAIYGFGEKIKIKAGQPQQKVSDLVQLMQSRVPEGWLNWFKRIYGGKENIGYKKFASAILYPYEVFETTHKQHLLQMNYAFKASIMYSSVLDSDGPARILKGSFETDIDMNINSKEEFLHVLDFGFITSSSSFLDKVRKYEAAHSGTINHLKGQILASGTAIQTLNLGFIFKTLGRDQDALECFDVAGQKGSFRGRIEMGNILLKEDFSKGFSFFKSLGAYGIWKIAQCFRYGRQTVLNLDKANHFYLEALAVAETQNYPEILFDAADFAVFYAYSQPRPDIFKAVIKGAVKRFIDAGELHLGLGYLRAGEISLDVVDLFPDITTSPLFAPDSIKKAAKSALMEGHASKATSLLEKIQLNDDADMIAVRGYAEQIDRYFGV